MCWHGTPNEVVVCMVSGYSAGTACASETMHAFGVDVGAAWTLTGLTKFGIEALIDGDSDGLVIQTMTAR
jgi:hypothetical protein